MFESEHTCDQCCVHSSHGKELVRQHNDHLDVDLLGETLVLSHTSRQGVPEDRAFQDPTQ